MSKTLRKVVALSVLVTLFTACGVRTDYDGMVQEALSKPIATATNKNKETLKYYTAPDVGVKDSTQLSTLLKVSDESIMMTIDVSDIIARKYYEKEEITSNLDPALVIYENKGTYLDRDDTDQHFILSIMDAGNRKAIVLENGLVSMISVVRPANLNYVLESMFVTLRSVDVDQEKIVAQYSNKEVIDYKPIYEEFFNHKVPETGTLLEIYNQLHPDDKIEMPQSEGEQ